MLSLARRPDEAGRLQALRALELLDSPAEDCFDALVRLAAALPGATGAALCLVDENRAWFKSALGPLPREVPRAHSLCAHAIEFADGMNVPDTRHDARFSDNPLVSGPPFIRSYWAHTVHGPSGHALGTLFAFSSTPMHPDQPSRAALADLARLAEELIRLRRPTPPALQARAQALREIHAPMEELLGLLELLSIESIGPRRRDLIETAHASARHLVARLDQVLLAAPVPSEGPAADVAFDPGSIAADAMVLTCEAAAGKDLGLSVELGRHVPTAMLGDVARLRRLLVDLTESAIKASEPGGVVLHVDRGAAADAPVVFAVSYPGSLPATDLVLARCRQVVALLGGHLSPSRVGARTVFSFSLPFRAVPVEPPAPEHVPVALAAGKARVLLVEDDLASLQIAADLLGQAGWEVTVAASGEAALAAYAPGRFDFVLMDFRMPGMDGFETTTRLRQLPGAEHLPIVAISTRESLYELTRTLHRATAESR